MHVDLIGRIEVIQKKRQFLRDKFVSEKILIGGLDFHCRGNSPVVTLVRAGTGTCPYRYRR